MKPAGYQNGKYRLVFATSEHFFHLKIYNIRIQSQCLSPKTGLKSLLFFLFIKCRPI